MSELTMISSAPTMTSREIAELTGKEHRNVMADIRPMLVELHGEGSVLTFQQTQVNPQNGQSYPIFHLPKRETLILVSGYSVGMRAKIIDRWQELETQAPKPAELSRMDLIRIAMEAESERLALTEKVKQQEELLSWTAPRAEFFEEFVLSYGTQGFREVCKVLKANEAEFRSFLLERSIMYRLGGRLTPHQNHIDAGRFEVKISMTQDGRSFPETKFTAKGVAWVGELWMNREWAREAA